MNSSSFSVFISPLATRIDLVLQPACERQQEG